MTYNLVQEIFQAFGLEGGRISFGHNFCDRVRRRCIKMVRGHGHSYNNAMYSWNDKEVEAAVEEGQLYSQQNVFKPDQDNCNRTDGRGVVECREINKMSNNGKIQIDGLHALGKVELEDYKYGGVDKGFISGSEERADVTKCGEGDKKCAENLYEAVTQNAGPRF